MFHSQNLSINSENHLAIGQHDNGIEAKIIVKREIYDDLIKNDVLEEVRVLQEVL